MVRFLHHVIQDLGFKSRESLMLLTVFYILRENYESDVDIECQEMARRFLLYFHADYKAADDGMSSSTQIAWLCDEHYYLCVEMNHLKQLLREQLDDGDLCLEAQHEYGKCFPHHSVL
jgi:hypothetical protein